MIILVHILYMGTDISRCTPRQGVSQDVGYLDLNLTGYCQTAFQCDGTSLQSQQQFPCGSGASHTP